MFWVRSWLSIRVRFTYIYIKCIYVSEVFVPPAMVTNISYTFHEGLQRKHLNPQEILRNRPVNWEWRNQLPELEAFIIPCLNVTQVSSTLVACRDLGMWSQNGVFNRRSREARGTWDCIGIVQLTSLVLWRSPWQVCISWSAAFHQFLWVVFFWGGDVLRKSVSNMLFIYNI